MIEQGLTHLREFVRRALRQLDGNADDGMEALHRQSRIGPTLAGGRMGRTDWARGCGHARSRRAVQESARGNQRCPDRNGGWRARSLAESRRGGEGAGGRRRRGAHGAHRGGTQTVIAAICARKSTGKARMKARM